MLPPTPVRPRSPAAGSTPITSPSGDRVARLRRPSRRVETGLDQRRLRLFERRARRTVGTATRSALADDGEDDLAFPLRPPRRRRDPGRARSRAPASRPRPARGPAADLEPCVLSDLFGVASNCSPTTLGHGDERSRPVASSFRRFRASRNRTSASRPRINSVTRTGTHQFERSRLAARTGRTRWKHGGRACGTIDHLRGVPAGSSGVASTGWPRRTRSRSSRNSSARLVAVRRVLRERPQDHGVEVGRDVGVEPGRRRSAARARAWTRPRPASRRGRAARPVTISYRTHPSE